MVTTLSHELMSRNTFKPGNCSFLQQRLQQLLQAAQVIIWPGQRLKKTINSTHRLHQLRPDTISDYYKNSQSQTLNLLLGRSKIRMVTEYYNSNVSSPKMRKFITTLFNHSQSFTLRTNKTKSLRMSSNATVQFECSWEIQWTGYLTYCSVVSNRASLIDLLLTAGTALRDGSLCWYIEKRPRLNLYLKLNAHLNTWPSKPNLPGPNAIGLWLEKLLSTSLYP